ncbi:MAG: PIG-L deacetylase family protein [Thermoprotei archaeon]|nr:PIG-L family deacetylase [TACK group archaeon]
MDLSRVLVFVAHPDDEVIGCGGTIRKAVKQGGKVRVVVFNPGGKSVAETTDEAVGQATRLSELDRVSDFLGFDHESWNIAEISNRREVVRKVVSEIRSFKPTMILTHSPGDRHHLHAEVSSVVSEATWHATQLYYLDLGQPWTPSAIYYFEVWDLFLQPSAIVNISDYMDDKVAAMKLYASQVEVFPYILDYLRALGKVRGLPMGFSYGEALMRSQALTETG